MKCTEMCLLRKNKTFREAFQNLNSVELVFFGEFIFSPNFDYFLNSDSSFNLENPTWRLYRVARTGAIGHLYLRLFYKKC